MRAGHRVEVETDKRDPEDFALWKAAEPGRVMKWASPWGEGFPGWHIECSAMSVKYLGEQFDIHTGGIDLKFPHHEDEIAQSEGVLGHPVVSIWMHGEFLTMAEAKMAKSAGNIIRVTDLPAKGFEPLAFRYLALTAHYRSKLDFTEHAMQAASAGLRRLRRAAAEAGSASRVDLAAEPLASYRARFVDAVSDDLGLPAALAVAHAVAGADDLGRPSAARCCWTSTACWAWARPRPRRRRPSCPGRRGAPRTPRSRPGGPRLRHLGCAPRRAGGHGHRGA